MKPRRPAPAPRKPTHFADGNTHTHWDAARLRAAGEEFEHTRFVGCDFGGASLAHLRFTDCQFENCNLAGSSLQDTGLQNVAFAGCKLLGVQFSACRALLFAVHFDHCQLGYASFAGRQMPGTRFAHCTLPEADFTNADLREAAFLHCALPRAIFHHTQLAGADFTTATDFALDPEANTLTGTRFSLAGLPGLLGKYGLMVSG